MRTPTSPTSPSGKLIFVSPGKFMGILRMTPLAALLILDQLPKVEAKIEALNRNYAILEGKLGDCLVMKL